MANRIVPLALDPHFAIFEVFFFPDGHRFLQPVNAFERRVERWPSMRGSDHDDDARLADLHPSQPVNYRNSRDGVRAGDLTANLRHYLNGHPFVAFVVKQAGGPAFTVVTPAPVTSTFAAPPNPANFVPAQSSAAGHPDISFPKGQTTAISYSTGDMPAAPFGGVNITFAPPAHAVMPAAPVAPAMPVPAPVDNPVVRPPAYLFAPGEAPVIQYLGDEPLTSPIVTYQPSEITERAKIAQMLGGEVDLMVLKMADAAVVSVHGRMDLNQLSMLAQHNARNELKIADLAQAAGAYGVGKQASQRAFGVLLTQYPKVYLLLNGFDPIISEGYLEVVMARVTAASLVQDHGRSTITLTL